MWVKVANEKSQVLYIKRLAIFKSDSRGIQTHNLLIRSQMLYSVELGSLSLNASAKVMRIFELCKLFECFLRRIFMIELENASYVCITTW